MTIASLKTDDNFAFTAEIFAERRLSQFIADTYIGQSPTAWLYRFDMDSTIADLPEPTGPDRVQPKYGSDIDDIDDDNDNDADADDNDDDDNDNDDDDDKSLPRCRMSKSRFIRRNSKSVSKLKS